MPSPRTQELNCAHARLSHGKRFHVCRVCDTPLPKGYFSHYADHHRLGILVFEGFHYLLEQEEGMFVCPMCSSAKRSNIASIRVCICFFFHSFRNSLPNTHQWHCHAKWECERLSQLMAYAELVLSRSNRLYYARY